MAGQTQTYKIALTCWVAIDTKNTTYILCNMKTVTSIKLDTEVKKEASKLASEMGLNLSAVVNATLKKFVRERQVVLSIPPEFNKKTRTRFLKMRQDVKNNKNISKVYTRVSDLRKALLT